MIELRELEPDKDRLFSTFVVSITLHLVVVGLGWILSNHTKLFGLSDTQKYNIKLARASVRVDVVAMPKYTIKELKSLRQLERSSGAKVEAPAQKKVEAPKKDDFIKKKKKVDFMAMIKDLSQKDVKKKKSKNKKKEKSKSGSGSEKNKINNQMRSKLNKLLVAGNKLGEGSAIVGSGDAGSLTVFEGYVAQLPEHVRPNWKLPSYLIDKDLKCRIKLYLSPSGEVIKTEIFESSGEEDYDKRALNAIKLSNPFPSLPTEIKKEASNGAIVLGFPL